MQQKNGRPPRVIFVSESTGTASLDYYGLFSGMQWESLRGRLLRAGFIPEEQEFIPLSSYVPRDEELVVGLGEQTLRQLTGLRGIEKWNLSPLKTKDGKKFIATFGIAQVQKQYELGLYQELCFHRAKEFRAKDFTRPMENFRLNPDLEETYAILDFLRDQDTIAVDVETGYGQINTVGFAWSPNDAIAISVLPDRCTDEPFFTLWQKIAKVLEGPSKKIFQNFIYDVSYFSAYGILTQNIHHDTMWAMKVLYPELKSNLGNVGRIYTRRPYWKDDGKVTDEEGAKKNWGDVRDWLRHYLYNCRDTSGTLEAYLAQSDDLKQRGLSDFYYSYLMRLAYPILEMCSNGMPVDISLRQRITLEADKKINLLEEAFKKEVGRDINPSSPKQILNYFKEIGIKIPKKYDRTKGAYRESTDASSIKKIRLKSPEIKSLEYLQEIKSLNKAISSYVKFDLRSDNRLSYSLNGAGTETLRWSGGKDPWNRGFNIQTIPREGGDVSIKSMFVAPDGYSFIEVDLRQAESRFVAYDSADKTLIDMLESGDDVHTHVGMAILKQIGKDPTSISKDEFKSTWRQLGKKAGHGLNYAMKAGVFVETVFSELDIVITKQMAESITEAYYGLFPCIPKWHKWIRDELYYKRKLKTPSGWERYFYGRYNDDMFKQAYAFRPQHTIPWITNSLLLYLDEWRRRNGTEFKFLVQVHDSLILLVRDENLKSVSNECLNYNNWSPTIELPGGTLKIPTEVKFGKCMANLRDYEGE